MSDYARPQWRQLAAGPFQLHVYHATEQSFGVTSTIVEAEQELVLIDAQFTLPDAAQLVARIQDIGKPLKAVFISHGDPDYYFGLQAIRTAFPAATVYASAPTVAHITHTAQPKLDFWGPKLGANGTTNVVLPQVLKGNTLAIGGHALEVIGLDGDDAEHSFVWLPDAKAAIGGVSVFSGLHLWMADAGSPERRATWLAKLDLLAGLHPAVVVPGHVKTLDTLDASTVSYTRQYLQDYEAALADAPSSTQLIERLRANYPSVGMAMGLEMGAKVTAGESKW